MADKRMPVYKDIDDYIANAPKETQEILKKIRTTIKNLVPDATETLGYGIPTFKLFGKNLVHFAAYPKHIGFYPTPGAIEVFMDDLKDYQLSKGTIQFPLDKPIPYELIEKITRYRIEQMRSKAKGY